MNAVFYVQSAFLILGLLSVSVALSYAKVALKQYSLKLSQQN